VSALAQECRREHRHEATSPRTLKSAPPLDSGLLPPSAEQLVDVLIGGQYGSEGKGNNAYRLAPEYDVLMRVGGPNAGHKVPPTRPFGSCTSTK
jgi:hypothetical protein